MGYAPPEDPYNPLFDPALGADAPRAFASWVSGYFQHGDTADAIERRVPLADPPPTLSILTDEERERLRSNAFASLERTIADREQLVQANERITDLLEASSRHWDDPYAQKAPATRSMAVSVRHGALCAARGY